VKKWELNFREQMHYLAECPECGKAEGVYIGRWRLVCRDCFTKEQRSLNDWKSTG